MGLFVSTGFLARAVGPVVITQLYKTFGPTISFSSIVGIGFTAVILFALVYRRIVPLVV